MDWSEEVRTALAAPFPEDEVEFLPRASANGRALALAHIDARTVMRRLDAVVQPEGWFFDFDVAHIDGKAVRLKGMMTVLGVTKCDAGEGREEDEPLKAAVSDAIKRCGVHFSIGRYLYYLPQIWVPYDAAKRRFTETPRISPGALEKALAICGYRGPMPEQMRSSNRAPSEQPRGAPIAQSAAPAGNGGAAPGETGEAAGQVCAGEGCGKPLTKGQYDVSMRAFGKGFCPQHQRLAARS